MLIRLKNTCCCFLKLEYGIYMIGGIDCFFFAIGIIGMIFLIMTRNDPEERNRMATTNHKPEEVPAGFLSPFLFELPRIIAFFYLICKSENENNLRARKIYYMAQACSLVMLTLIAVITIWITLAYIPNNYDERYCNARASGSDTHEAWAYYEQHRGAHIREHGTTSMPEYSSFMNYLHDNTTGSQCAKMMAKEETFFFFCSLAIYLYFYFISKSYYLEGINP